MLPPGGGIGTVYLVTRILIKAIQPKPAFRAFFQVATTRADSGVILIKEPPDPLVISDLLLEVMPLRFKPTGSTAAGGERHLGWPHRRLPRHKLQAAISK